MIDYSKSKIYKIIDNTTNNIYIGSTTQTLNHIIHMYKNKYNLYLDNKNRYMTVYEIIKNNNYEIILIEEVCCKNKEELYKRQRTHIESNICVNKYIPTRTDKERYQINKKKKESMIDNILLEEQKRKKKEEQHENRKQYYREYAKLNKEKANERQKKYYQKKKKNASLLTDSS